jgi:hypothetical protein
MPHRLDNLKLLELSLVDNPANQHSKVTLFKRDFSAERRSDLAASGAAMPDGSFPVENRKDLENAIKAVGRAKDPEAAKKHIIARAKALDCTDCLPDGWVTARKRLDRLTALQEKADLLAKEVNNLSVPSRLEALKARVDALQTRVAGL